MQQEGLLKSIFIFCHRNSITSQWQQSAEILGLKIRNMEFCGSEKDTDGWILTYQFAYRNLQRLKQEIKIFSENDLLSVADEAHHLGVNPELSESAVWGKSFLELTQRSTIRLGLTGTPFRSDNLAFCSARKVRVQENGELIEQIYPDLCVESRELICAGDVRPLEFHFQDGWVEHSHKGESGLERSPLSSEQRESWRARNLRRSIRLSHSKSIAIQILLKATKKLNEVRRNHKNAAGLVIAKDIEHAKGIFNALKEDGNSVALVHSQDKEAAERLIQFKEGKSKWLVSVDMCSEGFDAPRLRVVVYLTTVVTKSRFIQGITRAVRMSTTRACLESIPRDPSHVFAPADPLLMKHACNWSEAEPYRIKVEDCENTIESSSWIPKSPILPMEAVNDRAEELIRLKAAELPQFLK